MRLPNLHAPSPSWLPRFLMAAMLVAWIGPAFAAGSVLIRSETLRASASASSKALAKLGKGAQVDILARKGGWIQVSANGRTGWVRLLSVRSGGGSGGNALSDVTGLTQKRDNKVVAVAGLRGLDEEDLKKARFNAAEMKRLDSYQVSANSAEQFARQGGLQSRSVAFLPRPEPAKQDKNNWEVQ